MLQGTGVQSAVIQKISDNALIDKIKSGDMTSFELLVNRHKDFAFSIAYRVVLNEEDAEEVAHDAFIKALNSLDKFKGESKFTTWFYRVVLNMAISRQRKKRIRTEDIQDNPGGVMEYTRLDEYHGMNESDRTEFLNQAMFRLNEEERSLLSLYYFQELSMEEVEEISGIDKNNLKVKIFRARKKLAGVLSRLLPNEVESIL